MKELTDKFNIQCKECGSANVDSAHGEDFVYQEVVYIYCKDCGNEIEL
jgi:ribosomal protein S27E